LPPITPLPPPLRRHFSLCRLRHFADIRRHARLPFLPLPAPFIACRQLPPAICRRHTPFFFNKPRRSLRCRYFSAMPADCFMPASISPPFRRRHVIFIDYFHAISPPPDCWHYYHAD
jgi:hypothetical protein